MLPVYDLHSHSLCSDGSLSPQDLVSRAKEQGVTHLALTDHDTISGLKAAKEQALKENITLVNGIEFSTLWQGRNIHIVGLNLDVDNATLIAACEQQSQSRIERAKEISSKLAEKGLEGCYEGALQYCASGIIGRPHIAKYLVETGKVANMAQAFKRYLGAGKIGDVKQCWPDIQTAIGWIHAAGGVAVLAHPTKYTMTRTKLRVLLGEFKEAGGDAMEVICGHLKPGQGDDMQRLATYFNLLSSCGSDFHAPGQPWQDLGKFSQLPESAVPVWESWAN